MIQTPNSSHFKIFKKGVKKVAVIPELKQIIGSFVRIYLLEYLDHIYQLISQDKSCSNLLQVYISIMQATCSMLCLLINLQRLIKS